MGEDSENAADFHRRADIDFCNAPLGDGRGNDAGINKIRNLELTSVFCPTGHLVASIDAGCRCADISCHWLARLAALKGGDRRRCGDRKSTEANRTNGCRALQNIAAVDVA